MSTSTENNRPKSTLDELQLLTADEVAAALGVSRRTVWRMLSKQEMPAPIKFRGNTRWQACVIRDWIANGCPSHNNE